MSHPHLVTAFAVSCCQLLLLSCAAGRQVRFDYIGCFVDYAKGANDILGLIGIAQLGIYSKSETSLYFSSSASMTWQYCSSVCSLGGFAFMGVQHGTGCYCGNSYGSQGSGGTSCTSTCSGNSSQICGGTSRNSVFALTYLDTNIFVASARSNITVGSSYPQQPLYWSASANLLSQCLMLCGTACQAVMFSQQQSLCHVLKFSLVPSDLTATEGVLYTRR